MPTYTFRDKKTGEEHTEYMSIQEMEKYLKKNKQMDVVPSAPFIGDSVRQGQVKPSDGFRDILREMRHKLGKKQTTGVNTW